MEPSHTILQKIKKEKIDFVEFWFVDIFGELHSLGIPSYSVTEQHLRDGLDKLDSSSIRGFGSVNESDVYLMPDTSTFTILPPDYDAGGRKNARMFVNIRQRNSTSSSNIGLGYDRDSRDICLKTMRELGKFNLSKALWGPEIEFFVFDRINTHLPTSRTNGPSTNDILESEELARFNGIGTTAQFKSGYYQAQPIDTLNDLRKDMCDDLYRYFGIKVEAQHHEVATAGQCEINIEPEDTMNAADNLVTIKNMIKVRAKRRNKIATFMPKPIYGDNASAMHMHHSLWTADGHNAMYDPNDKESGLSQFGRYYIGGILDHAEALCAISNPITNSYKRLVPGYEAPIYACWGVGNRSAAIRIPLSEKNNEMKKRIEYRVPDAASNPYLLESSLIMAGLDGIRRKLDPGEPIKDNVYQLTSMQKRNLSVKPLPSTLKEALDALQNDHRFLKEVFTENFLDIYISIKRKEYSEFAQTPTPWELFTYYSI